MKKITLLSLFIATISFGQQFTDVTDGVSVHRESQAILFDQPSVGGSGIISSWYEGTEEGVYSADDFELEENSLIESITIYGFQNADNIADILTGFQLYIYENSDDNTPDGDPTDDDSGIINLDLNSNDSALELVQVDAGTYNFVIDIADANGGALELDAGTYWLAAAPKLAAADPTDTPTRFNWFSAGFINQGAEAHLIDPGEFFGPDFAEWTDFTTLGLDFNAIAFTIEGETNLSVEDNLLNSVSVYPNPAQNQVNFDTKGQFTIVSAVVFDITGKRTSAALTGNSIDISALSSGLYLVEVTTDNGEVGTYKFVKK